MILIMFGAPGVGKGSQATILAQALQIPHISTGDIFRDNIAKGTESGKLAKAYMDKGLLVPDALTIGLIMDRIRNEDCRKGFIVDGFPRTLEQAEYLKKMLNEEKLAIDTVVNITLEEAKIIDRIVGRRICPSCNQVYHELYKRPHTHGLCNTCRTALVQRPDDVEATIVRRLGVYAAQTKSVLSYYRKKCTVVDIVSKDDITETSSQIFKALGLDAAF